MASTPPTALSTPASTVCPGHLARAQAVRPPSDPVILVRVLGRQAKRRKPPSRPSTTRRPTLVLRLSRVVPVLRYLGSLTGLLHSLPARWAPQNLQKLLQVAGTVRCIEMAAPVRAEPTLIHRLICSFLFWAAVTTAATDYINALAAMFGVEPTGRYQLEE